MSSNDSTAIKTGEVPKVALGLLTGTQEKGGRAAGIFTKDDLISLLLYVRDSRKLPQDLDSFIKELGSSSTGIAGLEPNDILGLYKLITDHANRWTPVENQVKEQASNLTVASKDLVTVGESILKVINKMDIVAQMDTIGDSSTVKIPITSNKDQRIQKALPKVIDMLRKNCTNQQTKTREVRKAVRDYKTEISGGVLSNGTKVNGLEPAVADKKERAKAADLSGKITNLQAGIDALDKQIEQKKKDYDKYLGLSFTGAAGGPIGLLITGGLFGSKAEAARIAKNRLIKDKSEKSNELKRDQKIQGVLNIFGTQFTDVGMRLLDAEQALNHLDFLWTDILSRINQSVDKWKDVTDSEMLMSFIIDLQSIVDPWKEVGDMTQKLSDVFDEAYDEFRKTYEV